MSKQQILGTWDHIRQVHGVTMRAMALIPKDKLDSHPIQGMRTPRELMVHAYHYMQVLPEAVLKGSLTEADCKEPLDKVKTVDDLLHNARRCFEAGDKATRAMTDAQIQAMVPTAWGPTMPGFAMVNIVLEEHLHHRGQLYAYLRTFGIEPPFMWGFDQNEAAYQPQGASA